MSDLQSSPFQPNPVQIQAPVSVVSTGSDPVAVAQAQTNAQATAAAVAVKTAKANKAAADYAAFKADVASAGSFIKLHSTAFLIGGAVIGAAILGHIL